jgi:hypothetical protein
MTSPCVFHLLSHISDPKAFAVSKQRFIQNFARALRRQYKSSKQEVPEVLLIYSIEFKMTDIDEIEDTSEAFTPDAKASSLKLPFLHLHVCVIADCKKTIPQSFSKRAMQALNEIDGLTKARYFKSKDRKVKVFNEETKEWYVDRTKPQMYKPLKTEFDDVYDRVKYLAKVEQKDKEQIPFKKAFGTSELTKRKVTTAKMVKVATA